jgi:protein-L-isoaspartate(D-aspartate) O-methyltransferase
MSVRCNRGGWVPPGILMVLLLLCCNRAQNSEALHNRQSDKVKRQTMVNEQLVQRGIADPEVLRAMAVVLRHAFVPSSLEDQAYADWPLPIGYEQTISQPYIVAYMTEALEIGRGAKVLEVGTGSGYQAAVLAEMGADVYTIEIIPELGKRAAETLNRLGYKVHTRIGDGYDGWPTAAPFDAIIVTAAPSAIPRPLIDQLREGGRLVVPVGRWDQILEVHTKREGVLSPIKTLPVRFVPMTGKTEQLAHPVE